jgi:hypothetical protein
MTLNGITTTQVQFYLLPVRLIIEMNEEQRKASIDINYKNGGLDGWWFDQGPLYDRRFRC